MVSLNLRCLWALCLVTGTAEFQAYTLRKLGFGHIDFMNSPVWLQARRQTGRSSDGCTLTTSLERSRLLLWTSCNAQRSWWCCSAVLPKDGGSTPGKYFVMIDAFLWVQSSVLSGFPQWCSLTLPLHNSTGLCRGEAAPLQWQPWCHLWSLSVPSVWKLAELRYQLGKSCICRKLSVFLGNSSM